jgi:hypothetical protein
VIKRSGFSTLERYLKGGRCGFCSEKIDGVGFFEGGLKI